MVKLTPEFAEIYGIHAGDGYFEKKTGTKNRIRYKWWA